jgi:hypothetical protein
MLKVTELIEKVERIVFPVPTCVTWARPHDAMAATSISQWLKIQGYVSLQFPLWPGSSFQAA